MVTDAWRSFPSYTGARGFLLDAVGLAGILLGLVLVIRINRFKLPILLALAAGLRLLAVILVESPVIADWERYHRIAARISEGGAVFDIVPPGWPLALSVPYALFGPHPVLGGLLNAGLGVAAVWLVYRLATLHLGTASASAGAYLLAVSPDQVLMTPILGSEALYAFLVTAAASAAFLPGLLPAAMTGAALGASQYVRATSVYVLPAFLALLATQPQWRTRVPALTLAALVMLLPVIAHNRMAHDEWSVSTSRFGNWTLLVGTNQHHNGIYNVDDLRLIGGQPTTPEGSRLAQRIALQRITSDPAGFAALTVRKFNVLWASGFWAVRATGTDRPAAAQHALNLFAQVIYAAILVLAASGAWRLRREPVVILLLALVGLMTAAHAVIEVSDRYHAFVMPLMCMVAGFEVARRLGMLPGSGGKAAVIPRPADG
jgi:hypothetical protein